MRKLFSIFFVFLAVALAWNTLGETALASGSHDVATIEATQTKSAASTYPFGKERSFAAHNNAEGELSKFNSLSYCNTIYNSQEDTYGDAVVEEYVQRHATTLLLATASTSIQTTIRILLFPSHFFL
jgi:hypothetical protein